jgi:Uncharacterized protein conserved in bacteria
MTSVTPEVKSGQIAVLRDQARLADIVMRLALDGLTHEEALVQPTEAGNCINFVLGHALAVYDNVMPMVGQRPVLPAAAQKRYDRGSKPMRDGAEALHFAELEAMWEESAKRYDAGLTGLDPETLGDPAPFSPTGNADETIGSLLSTIAFHQSYHVGQIGLLRRIIGKPGVIG